MSTQFELFFQGLKDLGHFASRAALDALSATVTALSGTVTTGLAGKANSGADYTSANIPFTLAETSVAHGLGARPSRVEVVVVAKNAVADLGVGDEVIVPSMRWFYSTTEYGSAIIVNATHIKVRFRTEFWVLPITGSAFAVTSANFDLRVRAWK